MGPYLFYSIRIFAIFMFLFRYSYWFLIHLRIPVTLKPSLYMYQLDFTLSRSPMCPECGAEYEDGAHIVFRCTTRKNLRRWGREADWAELEKPIWVEEEGVEKHDAVEHFFPAVYQRLVDRQPAAREE